MDGGTYGWDLAPIDGTQHPWRDCDTHGWTVAPMDGPWHPRMGRRTHGWAMTPCPGDQPLLSLRQTAFPAHRSARSTTAPTGACADASTPSASPTSPVSPLPPSPCPGHPRPRASSAARSIGRAREWDLPFSHCPGRHPKAVLLSLYVPTLTSTLPSLLLHRMPRPYRHPRGDGG